MACLLAEIGDLHAGRVGFLQPRRLGRIGVRDTCDRVRPDIHQLVGERADGVRQILRCIRLQTSQQVLTTFDERQEALAATAIEPVTSSGPPGACRLVFV